MKTIHKPLLALLLTAGIGGEMAAAQTPPVVSLDQAVQSALQNNNAFKLSTTRVKLAEARLQQTKENELPQASASLSYSRYDLLNAFSLGAPGSSEAALTIPKGAFNATMGGVTVRKELFGGFAEKSARVSAELLAQASHLDADKDQAELTYNVAASYFNIVKIIKSASIIAQNIRQTEEREREVKNLEKEGIVTANEVLKIQLQKNNLQLSQLEVNKARETALFNFALLIGHPEQQAFTVDTTLNEQLVALAPVNDYIVRALRDRQEVKANDLRIRAAESAFRTTKSAFYPHLGLSAGYNYINPTKELFPKANSFVNAWNVGLGLSYNIGTLYGWKGRVHESKLNIEAANLQQNQQSEQIRNEVFSNYNAYQLAHEKLTVIRTAVTQATENYRLTESRFRNGLVLASDLLDAEDFLLQAQLNLVNSTIDARLAYHRLQKAVGETIK
ncbi:TolC family protein [Larkinella insperata]|uniref:TolC family protein n=1 Tax=Larkinella insperata TaxID=332158 RepID=A0ABW3QLL8_9BACT|nr:TolC family protein [Larkinella insperata]